MAENDTPQAATEQMFAAVGRAITQWSFVERDLSRLLDLSIGSNTWTAISIFYSVENWRAKLQLVDAAFVAYAHRAPERTPLLDEWAKLSDKVNDLARKRNKLAHYFVRPAQRTGTGAPHEPIAPALLSPPYGSPNWYRETGLNPPGLSLTVVQVGHLETAFHLLSEKIREFTGKVANTPELRDIHVRQALDQLIFDARLDQPVLEALERTRSSLE